MKRGPAPKPIDPRYQDFVDHGHIVKVGNWHPSIKRAETDDPARVRYIDELLARRKGRI